MKDVFLFSFCILFALCLLYTCSNNKSKTLLGSVIKEDSLMKSMIGEKILYEKDSVMVVDYSFWNDTYTLSNGIKVNKKLVK